MPLQLDAEESEEFVAPLNSWGMLLNIDVHRLKQWEAFQIRANKKKVQELMLFLSFELITRVWWAVFLHHFDFSTTSKMSEIASVVVFLHKRGRRHLLDQASVGA
ncbi:MAG: hypothetical protein Q8J97_08335, partial [Flavobacteriaceae bacterium]|nr:hypothetical protein [Flavobacteriaceae bacterium]